MDTASLPGVRRQVTGLAEPIYPADSPIAGDWSPVTTIDFFSGGHIPWDALVWS